MKITFQTAALESALASMQACTTVRSVETDEHAEAGTRSTAPLAPSFDSADEEAHA